MVMSNKDHRSSNALRAPIEVHNEILIPASPERVWDVLADVGNWPSWYMACRWVRINATSTSAQLESFSWKAHPLVLHSRVVHSLRPHCFKITADSTGLHAERKFMLCPGPNGFGTTVVSHETQYGFLPWLGRAILQRWLRVANQDMFNDLRAASVGVDKKARVARQKNELMKGFTLLLVAIAILACIVAFMTQEFQDSEILRPATITSVARVGGSVSDIRAKLGNDAATKTYQEGKTHTPGPVIPQIAWNQDTSEQSNNAGLERNLEPQISRRVLGESFIAATSTREPFMAKDSKNMP